MDLVENILPETYAEREALCSWSGHTVSPGAGLGCDHRQVHVAMDQGGSEETEVPEGGGNWKTGVEWGERNPDWSESFHT